MIDWGIFAETNSYGVNIINNVLMTIFLSAFLLISRFSANCILILIACLLFVAHTFLFLHMSSSFCCLVDNIDDVLFGLCDLLSFSEDYFNFNKNLIY